MDEGDVRRPLGKRFEGQGDERAGVAALSEQLGIPPLKVVRVDRPFFAGGEDADDSAQAGSLVKEGQEVDDESGSRMEDQGSGQVKAFGSGCMRVLVRIRLLSRAFLYDAPHSRSDPFGADWWTYQCQVLAFLC